MKHLLNASSTVASLFVLLALATLVACTARDSDVPVTAAKVVDDPSPAASAGVVTPPTPLAPPTPAAQPEPTEIVSMEEPIPAAGPASRAQPAPDSKQADANVLYVVARQESAGSWHFTVTVEHPDLGWEDYADGWDIVLPDGTVSKPDSDSPYTRLLLHPHETEQPFTRSQGGVLIPADVEHVTVRAHDIVDGFGGSEVIVDLDLPDGPGFEVQPLSQ